MKVLEKCKICGEEADEQPCYYCAEDPEMAGLPGSLDDNWIYSKDPDHVKGFIEIAIPLEGVTVNSTTREKEEALEKLWDEVYDDELMLNRGDDEPGRTATTCWRDIVGGKLVKPR